MKYFLRFFFLVLSVFLLRNFLIIGWFLRRFDIWKRVFNRSRSRLVKNIIVKITYWVFGFTDWFVLLLCRVFGSYDFIYEKRVNFTYMDSSVFCFEMLRIRFYKCSIVR